MKNFFTETGFIGSLSEPDPVFAQQADAQRGGQPIAPPCNQTLEHSHIPLSPKSEDLARRSAPDSAVSAKHTYEWRK
jgi:hypothetical protein